MKQKEKDLFSLRLRIVGGFVKAGQLVKLAEIADKYGKGYIHLTTRQGVEIPHVNFKHFEEVKKELAEVELQMGACGQRVRTVTACQGAECSHGLIDCLSLARDIDREYFGIGGHPHKFKIGITGCPNGCVKPQENDLGIMGRLKKNFLKENCNYCGLCAEVCPVGAIKVDPVRKGDDLDAVDISIESLKNKYKPFKVMGLSNGVDKEKQLLVYDAQTCIGCGDCVYSCPTDAWQKRQEGYTIFIGGKMGKFPKLGIKVFDFIENKEDVLNLIKKTLEFYKKEGKKGERFRETLDRVGLDKYKESVL